VNLLLLDADEVDDAGRAWIGGRRAEHLRRVLRVRPGQRLRGGIVRGSMATLTVETIRDDDTIRLRVEAQDATPSEPPALDLIVALPRPQVLHRVLQFAAAMGVRQLDLIAAWRVEKSYFQSPSLRPESIARHLRLGAEQGATTWIPEVAVHRRFGPFLPTLATRAHAFRVLAHPQAPSLESVLPIDLGADTPLAVAIGPEGGLIDREVRSLVDVGFARASLGPWVLRVEAALVAVLAQTALLRRMARE